MKMTQVKLRPLSDTDLEHILAWVNDNEVTGMYTRLKGKSAADERAYISHELRDKRERIYTIESAAGEYLGQVGLHEIDWSARIARLSIIIGNKREWGKGYGQAALVALVDKAFDEHGLERVYCFTREENAKMRHILGKLGFKEESVMMGAYEANGKAYDMVHYSMNAPKYEARPLLLRHAA